MTVIDRDEDEGEHICTEEETRKRDTYAYAQEGKWLGKKNECRKT
jgi:hypothetical protein